MELMTALNDELLFSLVELRKAYVTLVFIIRTCHYYFFAESRFALRIDRIRVVEQLNERSQQVLNVST